MRKLCTFRANDAKGAYKAALPACGTPGKSARISGQETPPESQRALRTKAHTLSVRHPSKPALSTAETL